MLAAANAAVAAVKKGCELYKEAKSVAGNVKDVLDDLRKQFNQGPRTKEAKVQYDAEVKRVKETATAEPHDTIAIIGDHLGKFFDAYDAIEKLFWEEERRATEVYSGDESVGKRALQRVLIRTRLQAMQTDIREEMVYRTPPELKDLWTRFEKMREQILNEQKTAKDKELRELQRQARLRARLIVRMKEKALWIGAVLFVAMWYVGLLLMIRTSLTYRGLY